MAQLTSKIKLQGERQLMINLEGTNPKLFYANGLLNGGIYQLLQQIRMVYPGWHTRQTRDLFVVWKAFPRQQELIGEISPIASQNPTPPPNMVAF